LKRILAAFVIREAVEASVIWDETNYPRPANQSTDALWHITALDLLLATLPFTANHLATFISSAVATLASEAV
jgi:hypothetical protein